MSHCEVLLLEDVAFIAMEMEIRLEAQGFSVMGPCLNLEEAYEALQRGTPDVAVLDVNLGDGETSFSLAEDLHKKGVPVVFLSGYSADMVPPPSELKDAQRLTKPVREDDLLAAITAATSA